MGVVVGVVVGVVLGGPVTGDNLMVVWPGLVTVPLVTTGPPPPRLRTT